MINRRLFLVGTALVAAPAVLHAQTAPTPARLRGTIDAVSATGLDLTLRNGTKAHVVLAETARMTWLTVTNPADVKTGSYIGTVTVPQADGSLKALEVHVFPPARRGVGEGSRAWDLMPQSMMTNGTVGNVVMAQGRMMTVTYAGGEKHVLVPDDVPFVTNEPADRTALTVGAHVLVNGTRAADGTVTGTSVAIGKNGLVPPM